LRKVVNFEQTRRTLAAYFVDYGRFRASRRLFQLACLINSSCGDGEPDTSCAISAEDEAMDSPTVVLYIDDLPQVLQPRKATLESHGYCVRVASSGHAAIKLGGMDAEALACHIKQRFPNLPIILLSAYAEMPERILWLVDEYVMKSEPPERMVPIVERVHRLALRSDEG
jgi:CheY-like chemotaxis protein